MQSFLCPHMDKIRTHEEEEFIGIGEHRPETHEVVEKPIYFDGQQHSAKLPSKFLQKIGYEKGDCLRFELINPLPTEAANKPKLIITYAKKNG